MYTHKFGNCLLSNEPLFCKFTLHWFIYITIVKASSGTSWRPSFGRMLGGWGMKSVSTKKYSSYMVVPILRLYYPPFFFVFRTYYKNWWKSSSFVPCILTLYCTRIFLLHRSKQLCPGSEVRCCLCFAVYQTSEPVTENLACDYLKPKFTHLNLD